MRLLDDDWIHLHGHLCPDPRGRGRPIVTAPQNRQGAKRRPLMCQIRFDSAVWPGARQPSGSSTSEAYGPVSIGIKLFRLSAPLCYCNRHAQTIKNNSYQATECHIALLRLDLNYYFYFLLYCFPRSDPLVLTAAQ